MHSRPLWPLLAAFLAVACSAGEGAHPPTGGPPPPPPITPPPPPPATCVALSLAAESGFVGVPAQPTAATYPANMFYAFTPADSDPACKPLVVLFNGGPGCATSTRLLAYGTGKTTLDAMNPDAPPAPNPASWTRFANLLYIDQRQTGFSYGFGSAAGVSFSEVEDAADFVRVILHFLDTHDAVRANPVVIAGESYGGTRATWILDLLLRYDTQAARGGSDLQGVIQAHLDAALPGHPAGMVLDARTIAKQFFAQVLIEPLVLGQPQYDAQARLMPSDPYVGAGLADAMPPPDNYDVSKPAGWTDSLDARAVAALGDPSTARAFLGVDLASIRGMLPAARTNAFRLPEAAIGGDAITRANATLAAALGQLSSYDRYLSSVIVGGDYGPATGLMDEPQAFYANLQYVRTFITHARYDGAIYAPAIPAVFADRGLGGAVDNAPRPGVERPGWFTVTFAGDAGTSSVEVRFPPYDSSGHMVATTQATELASDVAAWLRGTP